MIMEMLGLNPKLICVQKEKERERERKKRERERVRKRREKESLPDLDSGEITRIHLEGNLNSVTDS